MKRRSIIFIAILAAAVLYTTACDFGNANNETGSSTSQVETTIGIPTEKQVLTKSLVLKICEKVTADGFTKQQDFEDELIKRLDAISVTPHIEFGSGLRQAIYSSDCENPGKKLFTVTCGSVFDGDNNIIYVCAENADS